MSDEVLPPSSGDGGEQPRKKLRRGTGYRNANAADHAAELERAERRAKAMRLRVQGHSIRAIGKMLGVSKDAAFDDIKRYIRERPQEDRQELLTLATEALEMVLRGHLKRAKEGDDKSAMVVIRAVEAHAKLNGYGAPAKHEHTGKDGGPVMFSLDEIQKAAAAAADNVRERTDGQS